ncbi:uncharacterized protein LOC129589550 [Paramacrobiotus metropolitanus]|uniref:uncharacterized protein LOC129589550 n=1 Tax=Paramacrobiotus metropolitanus TaxID=2943436 RepID=UPI002446351E|nr:uncharacterized protein LOC129589550 [Paramacrobiotus metropolitanus]
MGRKLHSLSYLLIPFFYLNNAKAVSDEDGNVVITEDLFQTPIKYVDDPSINLWPNRTAIPYVISEIFSASEQQAIVKALRIMEKKTGGCILFKPKTSEDDYIYFFGNFLDKCDSKVGRVGGRQYVDLARPIHLTSTSCINTGRIQHELMHALGFRHEQQRPDRDQYVDVRSGNVIPADYPDNFVRISSINTFGLKYDYHSVMHYDAFAFAVFNNSPVLIPKKGLVVRMGQQLAMTPSDVAKIALTYKCPLTIRRVSQTARKRENFPNFSLEPIEGDRCQVQFNDYCAPGQITQENCRRRNYFHIRCRSDAPVPVLESMTAVMADKTVRPVSIDVDERLISSYSFEPIRIQVLKLQIHNCTTERVTLRLKQLNFVNLLHLELHHCHNLIIEKTDISVFQQLRITTFRNSTVHVMQPGTFTDLPEMRIISLEALSATQKNQNFEAPYREFLRRLHCSCEFSWYRSWWRSNKQLRLKAQIEELYSFDGPTSALLCNDEFSKEGLFHPINCSDKPFPLSTEWISYYTQIEYSINEPLCNQTLTVTSSTAMFSTLILDPTATGAPTFPLAPFSTTLLPRKIGPLALSPQRLRSQSIPGILVGALFGIATLFTAITLLIKNGRCRTWVSSLRNSSLSFRVFRNREPSSADGIAIVSSGVSS